MSTLEGIKKGIEACRTYNFGMRYADKLAHEDADKLIAALEAVQDKAHRLAGSRFIEDQEIAADLRAAISEALA